MPRGPGVLTLSGFRPGGRHPEKEVLLGVTRCYSVLLSDTLGPVLSRNNAVEHEITERTEAD